MKFLLSLFAFGLILVACTPRILTPPSGPGTDYPCGLRGLSCGGGMCCWQGEVCGGSNFNGCPAGFCCYVGPSGLSKQEPQMPDYDVVAGRIAPPQ